MDAVRVQLAEVMASERALLEQRQATEAGHDRLVTLILGIGTLAAVILSLMLNGMLLRSATTEARLSREVESRNAQLEEQNLELEMQSQQLQEQATELEMQNEELQATSEALAEQATELEMQTEQLESTIRALDAETQSAEAARAAAEVANRAKSDFLATMSHELRTPLNAIAGYAQLMQLGVPEPVPPAHHEYLTRIQQSQRHLLGVINSVLNFARIEAGSVIYDMADVSIAMLLAEVEPLVAPQMQARGHDYACLPCDPTLVVRADPDKVRQVLLNLLSNAIKFTPPGGQITLSAEGLVDDPSEKFAAIRVREASGRLVWQASRLDPDHPAVQWAAASIQRTTGKMPALLPCIGASMPNDVWADMLGMPTVWVPHSYGGCSQHAPNEHGLGSLMREGLEMMGGLFWDLAECPPDTRRPP